MDTAFETLEVRGLTVRLHYDPEPESPREWDNAGKMVCWHGRYNLGDEQPRQGSQEWLRSLAADLVNANDVDLIPDEHIERIIDKHVAVMLPLYLFDHSGLAMSTSSGRFRACDSMGWDWGGVGWIYVTMEQARKEWTGTDDEIRAQAEKCLIAEVEVYDDYLQGQVFGYEIEDEDGNHLDSCWGFYGLDDMTKEARGIAERLAAKLDQNYVI